MTTHNGVFAMRLHRLAFAAVLFLASPALALDAGDRSFGPGRVGAIVKGATEPAELARIYGAGNVSYEKVHLAEGEYRQGAVIYRGTANELQVGFTEDGKKIEFIRIAGSGWKSKEGIRIGTTLAELERINGGPFKFLGFGWDNGGNVVNAAKLPKGVIISLSPTRNRESKQARQVQGDNEFSSRHPAFKNLGVVVSGLTVTFGP
jgi:hypothetical protein